MFCNWLIEEFCYKPRILASTSSLFHAANNLHSNEGSRYLNVFLKTHWQHELLKVSAGDWSLWHLTVCVHYQPWGLSFLQQFQSTHKWCKSYLLLQSEMLMECQFELTKEEYYEHIKTWIQYNTYHIGYYSVTAVSHIGSKPFTL